ncbi:hypothetical protein DL990_03950 [Amycolatopsis sp. WAC 01416]|uniref:DUF4328 domain-containing protein n=1 Tax=Amycolatopsis sp. WAC 01416 TaxID=2203196 RepID=UPI000F786D6D|nr:DUF4328 domain-containing protein [Amycolatopsis sp. WAC 01416]RSN38309.1 hypothetical protein DL990_03950 [Amycolatopsis sp. WAC 01416]
MPPVRPAPMRQPAHHRVRWVASPPPGAWPQRRKPVAERYSGPPSYPVPPRWGFPNLVWRRPTAVPGTASGEVTAGERLRVITRSVLPVLWTFAALAVAASASEIWRYVLLVQSRDSALSTSVVSVSDSFVITTGLLTTILSLLPSGLTVWWLLVARHAAADASGEVPPRPQWQVLVFALVPVVNLIMVLPIVAELEHAVLRRTRETRPKPSRLVLIWWGVWMLNWLLLGLVIVWRFRDGVQALAGEVVLVALTDLAAAGLAVVTALLVKRMSGLLAPVAEKRLRLLRVLKVDGAPDPDRRERPASALR